MSYDRIYLKKEVFVVVLIFYRFTFEFFATAGLILTTSLTFLDQCSKAISFLTTDSCSVHKNGNMVPKFMDAVNVSTVASACCNAGLDFGSDINSTCSIHNKL